MELEYDHKKNRRNIEQRGISFEFVARFEWDSAIVWQDNRRDYGEIRYCALGYIGERIFQLAFTMRGDTLRVISLRKANQREVKRYAET